MTVHKLSIISPILPLIVYYRYMSTLHHESILETCYEEVMQEASESGNLAMMNSDDIEFAVQAKFEALCQ